MTPTQRVQAGLSAVSDKFKQTQGQPGGIRSVAPSARAASYTDPVERMRGKYFDNRQDVSRDRLERRLAQQQQNVFDRLTMFKPVQGSSNLLQSRTPGGPSIADVQMQTAMKYGPTLREIGSDIAYATGKTAGALGQKFAAGELGIMGIVKGLYEQFTNRAAQAKNFLGDQVNKLSDIDLEFLKNEDKYNFMSKKPSVLKAKEAEALSKQADANLAKLTPYKNLFGDYYDFGGPSMPGEVKREELGSIGVPTTQPTEEELNVIRGASISNNYSGGLGQTPTFSRTAEMIERNPNTGTETVVEQFQNPSPSLLNALAGQEQVKKSGEQFVQGLRDVGYFEKGGSVDNKLNEIQKSTNNIYGTGILSVR